MLILCRVAALNVTEGRVGINNAKITQVLQCNQIFALIQPIQPAATECKCPKVSVNNRQQLLRFIHPEINNKISPETEVHLIKSATTANSILHMHMCTLGHKYPTLLNKC